MEDDQINYDDNNNVHYDNDGDNNVHYDGDDNNAGNEDGNEDLNNYLLDSTQMMTHENDALDEDGNRIEQNNDVHDYDNDGDEKNHNNVLIDTVQQISDSELNSDINSDPNSNLNSELNPDLNSEDEFVTESALHQGNDIESSNMMTQLEPEEQEVEVEVEDVGNVEEEEKKPWNIGITYPYTSIRVFKDFQNYVRQQIDIQRIPRLAEFEKYKIFFCYKSIHYEDAGDMTKMKEYKVYWNLLRSDLRKTIGPFPPQFNSRMPKDFYQDVLNYNFKQRKLILENDDNEQQQQQHALENIPLFDPDNNQIPYLDPQTIEKLYIDSSLNKVNLRIVTNKKRKHE